MPRFRRRTLLLTAIGAVVGCTAPNDAEKAEMTDDAFWALIEHTIAYEADPDRQLVALADELRALSPKQIEAFQTAFDRQMQRAYDWELWGALYVINGGMSDDSFEYARYWLISKGRRVYESVLAEPEILADLVTPDAVSVRFEDFGYVAVDVWTERSGRQIEDFAPERTPRKDEPSGVPFEEDDAHLAARYPKLWRRFGDAPLLH